MCSGIWIFWRIRVCLGACLFVWLDIVFKNKVQLVDWFSFIYSCWKSKCVECKCKNVHAFRAGRPRELNRWMRFAVRWECTRCEWDCYRWQLEIGESKSTANENYTFARNFSKSVVDAIATLAMFWFLSIDFDKIHFLILENFRYGNTDEWYSGSRFPKQCLSFNHWKCN